MHVALYGSPSRWAMTERRRRALHRDATTLSIGNSRAEWDGSTRVVHVDEVCAPIPTRIRGPVRVHPTALTGARFTLDTAGRHRCAPIAPASRVEVALDSPGLIWSGPGYLDTNSGDRPLEADFMQWDWCRAPPAAALPSCTTPNACRAANNPWFSRLRQEDDAPTDAVSRPRTLALSTVATQRPPMCAGSIWCPR